MGNISKIAFTVDQLIICGGLIVPAIYVRELRKLGYDAGIYAKQPNNGVLDFYTDAIYPYENLSSFDEKCVIINVWWRMGETDIAYKGRKIQLVQGNDIAGNIGEDYKKEVLAFRNDPRWDLIGVSDYALAWTGRNGIVIQNGVDDRFFEQKDVVRDIDALIEGNDEPNKNIEYAIKKAKEDGHKRIVWMGRQTRYIDGVECITNPSQEEIPQIYRRAKHFYKYSLSEGFCLPILEAKASGCIIHTWDQGHNFPKDVDPKDYQWGKSVTQLLDYLNGKIS